MTPDDLTSGLIRKSKGVSSTTFSISAGSDENALHISKSDALDGSIQNQGFRNLTLDLFDMIYFKQSLPSLDPHIVSCSQASSDKLIESFSRAINLSSGEDEIEDILRSVDNRFRKVRVLRENDQHIIKADLGLSSMIPLSQTGVGMKRLIEIFSNIIGGQFKLLIIDELESGIHHSQLKTLWRGISEVSARYDVQVFATTHSYECITAAHEVFLGRADYDFSLIQLFRTEIECTGRVLQKETIEAAIENDIELR